MGNHSRDSFTFPLQYTFLVIGIKLDQLCPAAFFFDHAEVHRFEGYAEVFSSDCSTSTLDLNRVVKIVFCLPSLILLFRCILENHKHRPSHAGGLLEPWGDEVRTAHLNGTDPDTNPTSKCNSFQSLRSQRPQVYHIAFAHASGSLSG